MGQSIDIENLLILIVEDDDMNFTYLNQIFKIEQCEIIRARTGYEGIALFKQNKHINLVLMDIKLPDIDGYEVTRKIHRINPNIPIIAQTAGRSASEIEEAKKAGCTDVIIKPFKMEELIKKINNSLSE